MNYCINCQHYGRGIYAVVEVCLLKEVQPTSVSPVDGWRSYPTGSCKFRGRHYMLCDVTRQETPDCPNFKPWPPIKWYEIWKWFR